jgi:membrane protein implicated in regulation of membrane protease activity
MGVLGFVVGFVGAAALALSLGLPWFSTLTDNGLQCNVSPLHILSGFLQSNPSSSPLVLQLQEYLSQFPVYKTHLKDFFDVFSVSKIMEYVSKMDSGHLIGAGVFLLHAAAFTALFGVIAPFLALFGTGLIGFVLYKNGVMPCLEFPWSGPVFAAVGVLLLLLGAQMASKPATKRPTKPLTGAKSAGATAKTKKAE